METGNVNQIEQKLIITDNEEKINSLLRDGWKIISITAQSVSCGNSKWISGDFAILLERPKK